MVRCFKKFTGMQALREKVCWVINPGLCLMLIFFDWICSRSQNNRISMCHDRRGSVSDSKSCNAELESDSKSSSTISGSDTSFREKQHPMHKVGECNRLLTHQHCIHFCLAATQPKAKNTAKAKSKSEPKSGLPAKAKAKAKNEPKSGPPPKAKAKVKNEPMSGPPSCCIRLGTHCFLDFVFVGCCNFSMPGGPRVSCVFQYKATKKFAVKLYGRQVFQAQSGLPSKLSVEFLSETSVFSGAVLLFERWVALLWMNKKQGSVLPATQKNYWLTVANCRHSTAGFLPSSFFNFFFCSWLLVHTFFVERAKKKFAKL